MGGNIPYDAELGKSILSMLSVCIFGFIAVLCVIVLRMKGVTEISVESVIKIVTIIILINLFFTYLRNTLQIYP